MSRSLTPIKTPRMTPNTTIFRPPPGVASVNDKQQQQHNHHHPLEEISSNTSSTSRSTNEGSDTSSPTKRLKDIVLQTPYSQYSTKTATSISIMSPHRSFGEELDSNPNRVIIDTTLVSLADDSKDSSTALSSLTGGGAKYADDSTMSDTNTEVSSVAHLRGWLDDFGKQQKKHFDVNTKIGQAPDDAQRPTRPKVGGSAQKKNRPTPLPPPAASALAKRLVDTGLPRAKPVRIQTKVVQQDVRATNEGYKSVKELSAWLADDPTKSKKKVMCLRRGANVIAKSRAFDKGLKDVIIEQDIGGSVKGLVASKKKLLAPNLPGTSRVAGEQDSDADTETDWPSNDVQETATTLSVSDKKEWLANAFKNDKISSDFPAPKAHTAVVTNQDEREAVSNRAKHLWRQRSVRSNTKPSGSYASPIYQTSVSTETNITASEDDSNEPSPTKYGFAAARDFLVKKARQNGNPVDISKVKNRAAKFERLEKEVQNQSSSNPLLKTAWVESDSVDGERSSDTFVRTLVSNTAPKKSLHELP